MKKIISLFIVISLFFIVTPSAFSDDPYTMYSVNLRISSIDQIGLPIVCTGRAKILVDNEFQNLPGYDTIVGRASSFRLSFGWSDDDPSYGDLQAWESNTTNPAVAATPYSTGWEYTLIDDTHHIHQRTRLLEQ